MTHVAVFGLGEAGALYARGLRDAGYEVTAYDPFTTLDEPGIRQLEDAAEVLKSAQLAISLVGARAAETVANTAFSAAPEGLVFADLNTGAPALKAGLEERAREHGVRFVDVAVLAPVPREGVRSPLMVSGDGAESFVELFAATAAPVEAIEGAAGSAAARKLVRSVFMKGLAAVTLESIGAAQKAGCEDWLREQIAGELTGDPAYLIDRLISGSKQHAARRVHEVEDTHDYLVSIGEPTWVTDAAREWLSSLLPDAPAA